MKHIKYLILTVFLASTFVACENVDFGDTNNNPNGSTTPATSGLLSGAIMNYATQTNRTGITIPTLMVQHQAQVTYTDEMLYAQTPYSWTAYYSTIINPLNSIINITSDEEQITPEVVLQGYPANQQAVAMIFRAIVMKRVTDLYGEVPFSQAGKGLEGLTPEYDTQESIYQKLISEVQAARDMINSDEAAPTGDILLKGDMEGWKKLANSFLMQMALQISKRYPDVGGLAATTFNEALAHEAGVIDEVSEEAWFSYADLNGFRNPWNANRTADYFLTQEFTDAIKGNVGAESLNPTSNHTYDERYLIYVRRTAANPTPDGVPYGFRDGSGAGRAQMNRNYYWNPTSPLPLMTASYTFLNRAEAAALNWTTEDELELLEQGILASYETLQTHSQTSLLKPAGEVLANGAAYAAARVADANTVGALQVIAEEKWVTLFGQAFDAWAEWRRTGLPELIPATDALNNGEIPTRFIYPREEATLNGANYDAAVGRLNPGSDENTARVWWDVD